MKILQGTVVDGRVVVADGLLEEGAKVTIVDESDEQPYRLSPEEESAIDEGEAEVDRGEFVTAAQLVAEIRRLRG